MTDTMDGTGTMDGTATDRVAVLERYQVLDRPPRRELLALVDLAARVSGVPMATINLITDTQQHQVATVGFERSICSYEESMCTRVLEDGRPIVSYDAREDERFSANPFVTGALGNVRFYASHPLTTPEGVMIGTLCVFDDRPRRLETEQAGMLATLASRVMDVLELELRGRQLESALGELQVAHDALARSNERLAAFAGQVSHDLKNPLTALELSLGLMEEEIEDLGEAASPLAHLVGRASRGAVRMEAMIGDLLTFAQLGGNPQLTDVPLVEVVEAALHDLDGSLPDEGGAGRPVADRARGRHPAARRGPEPAGQRGEVHRAGTSRGGRDLRPRDPRRLAGRGHRPRPRGRGGGPGARLRADGAGGQVRGRLRDRAGHLPPHPVRARRPDRARPAARRWHPGVVRAAREGLRPAAQSRCDLPGRSSIRCSATLASRSVSGSTSITLTAVPATSDSSAHTRWGRSIRFIVEQ